MLRHNFYIIFLLVISLVAYKMEAQTFEDDARLWMHLELDKDLSKNLNVHLALQNRINENITRYSRVMTELGFTYKLAKNFKLLGEYSFGFNRRLDDSYSKLHRLDVGFVLKKKFKKLTLSSRNLMQWQYKDVFSSENGHLANIYYRTKLTFHYQLNKRFNVYVAQEINLALQSRNEDGLSRSRTFFGTVYKLTKQSDLECYFLFQRQYKLFNAPERDFIYGVKYSKSF